ncbi:hypothetical protein ACVWXO_002450 [Bradyrhizobium sp. LM2.7]
MRESRTYGSVRGALSNERPYRDRYARNDCGVRGDYAKLTDTFPNGPSPDDDFCPRSEPP